MPTAILLNVSLSMARPFSSNENKTYLDVAVENICRLLDYFKEHNKLEYVSLVVFSSLYEVLVNFTRDFELIKNALLKTVTYDKTVIETALQGLESCVTKEWGLSTPINVILITDGTSGIGEGSLKESLDTFNDRNEDNVFPLPFDFPSELSIICLNKSEKDLKLFEDLISINYNKGRLYALESSSEKNVQECFERLLKVHYDKFEVIIKCGNFESVIRLSPPPSFNATTICINRIRHNVQKDFDFSKLKLASIFKIVGFLDLQDFSNPPYLSKHMITPVQMVKDGNKAKEDFVGFQPSFCVLLHGSLKMEKMGALVQVGDDWYGMLYSWADTKKKSSLMISILEPGEPFSWCGNLQRLGPAYELSTNPYRIDFKDNTEESPFPVVPPNKRSYHTQSNAVWIKQSGLQPQFKINKKIHIEAVADASRGSRVESCSTWGANDLPRGRVPWEGLWSWTKLILKPDKVPGISDIQKLLRYAKKLPEKQSAFFKEVNKIRRAGVIYSFHEMLHGLAKTLENEGSNVSTEVSVQLRHVAEGLRNAPNRDLNKNIVAINLFR